MSQEVKDHIDGSPVVSGLVAKRREVAGLLRDARAEVSRLEREMERLDDVIRMFRPEMPVEEIEAPRRQRRLPGFRPGELGRLVSEHLRTADTPRTARSIAEALTELEGLDLTPSQQVQLHKNVTKALRRCEANGLAAAEGGARGAALLWSPCDDGSGEL